MSLDPELDPWAGLSPPYRTIVADPPWPHRRKYVGTFGTPAWGQTSMPYPTMPVEEIATLPVEELAEEDAVLYLWTTNRFLRDAFDVAAAWGFRPAVTLVWSKPPRGVMGGEFVLSSEFVLYGKRGSPSSMDRHLGTVFDWARPAGHSVKPAAFGDLVETVSPGPYVELFARSPRLGWDSWGDGW